MPDASADPKIVMLVRLLAAVDEGHSDFEGLKQRLSAAHPPSTRTLRRYLATLTQAGFRPTFDRATGTYRFADGCGLRRLQLAPREVLGITTMRGLARSLGGDLATAVDDAVRKVMAVSDSVSAAADARPAVRIHVSGVAPDPAREAVFALLQTAQRDARTVRFSYVDKRGRRSLRTVHPYGFVVSGGRAYLVAFDQLRNAQRVFALDAISDARLGARRFQRPADFDIEAFAAKSISGTIHADESTRVTVRFSPVVAAAAKADHIVRELAIVERDDGSVDITYDVADPMELVRWTFRWGTEAHVIAPAEVRKAARDAVQAMLRRYTSRR